MQLKINKGGLEFSSLVKMIAVGYAISVSILFALVFIIVLAKSASNDIPLYKGLAMLFLVPVIALLQGLLLGCLINFGLFLYKKKWNVSVTNTY